MGPYILLATALVLLGVFAWIWRSSEGRGEPMRLLLVWLCLSAVTATIAAAGILIGDTSVSRSFVAAAHVYFAVLAFLLFLFTRSFSVAADYRILFWSVPLQLGIAVIVMNWQYVFKASGSDWVLDMSKPAAIAVVAVNWVYGLLALAYAFALYLTLRREARQKEKERTLLILAAIVILSVATAIRVVSGEATGYVISISYLGHLTGVLLMVWAFRGPAVFKSVKR